MGIKFLRLITACDKSVITKKNFEQALMFADSRVLNIKLQNFCYITPRSDLYMQQRQQLTYKVPVYNQKTTHKTNM